MDRRRGREPLCCASSICLRSLPLTILIALSLVPSQSLALAARLLHGHALRHAWGGRIASKLRKAANEGSDMSLCSHLRFSRRTWNDYYVLRSPQQRAVEPFRA
ncbi:hypothetical protein EJ06DRAFT_30434 [Trichodelitschia bisporula]|uniref:Uncharacterized protein n=1 Tax=Trichodelitschia bisporula TaxID=703511 RepID=A0A6G1IC50_9PEZI|nr:hypothetical protein EJ06DRAFT_30434 [Trichodelitschia bisporula]